MYSGKKNNMIHPSDDDNYFFGDSYNEYSFSRDSRLQVGSNNLSSSQNGSTRGSAYGSRSSFWSDEIPALTNCDQFYLYQANKFTPDVASNYDIRNAEGKLIFKAVESEDVDLGIKDLQELQQSQQKPPFVLSIIDMKTGKEVLKINGNLTRGVMRVYAKQYSTDRIIGIVRRVEQRCSLFSPPTFVLERPNGLKLHSIRSSMKSLLSCCCLCTCRLTAQFQTRSFNLFLPDDVTYIGDIRHTRKKFNDEVDPEANRTRACLIANIPEDATSSNKALLIASMFMLDYTYFQRNRRSFSCPKISTTCTVIIIIVVACAVIGFMAVFFGGGGYSGEKISKGKAPKG